MPTTDRTTPSEVYLTFATAKLALSVLGVAALTGFGVYFMGTSPTFTFRWWLGLVGAVVFAVGLGPAAILALLTRRRLGVGKRGVWIETWRDGAWQAGDLLAWNGIFGAEIVRPGQAAKLWRGTPRVVLLVNERLYERQRAARPRLIEPLEATHSGYQVVAMPLTLAARREEVLAVLRQFHAAYGPRA